MTLIELPRVVPDRPGRPDLGDLARRMRELTLAIATDDATWTKERAAEVGGFFDSMASGWRERDAPERHDALADALARGGPFPNGWCVEVGSGTGNETQDLRTAFGDVLSTDLSLEMLRLAPFADRRLQADASSLPLRTGSAQVVALINMFLFPHEISRVLATDGVVIWVSTNGDATPIYLSPREVMDALPGTWDGITSQAGWGTWLTARRRPD
jgi:Methyltransferase domain